MIGRKQILDIKNKWSNSNVQCVKGLYFMKNKRIPFVISLL